MRTKRFAIAVLVFAALYGASGCKTQTSDNDAIRAGILQHLKAVGTLNISAMQMDIRNVSINGNQAHAEVEFRPKTGAAPGTGMQVAYYLEKRDGSWTVLRTQAAGGAMQHPDPSQNPHQNQTVHPGSLPNFNSVLNPAGTPGQAALPPGHPGVASQQLNSPSAGEDTASARKPR
ncbi:MAG TPA: hypothetical protein VJO16_14375 [Candidatus Acidoferrum sp.]|nr:hypothetical protein [Candidatus Acidoferrum sp.]